MRDQLFKKQEKLKLKSQKRVVKKRGLWVVSLLLVVSLWVFWTNTHIEVNHLEIQNEKIPLAFNETQIAVIADLHNKDWGVSLISKLEKEAPDFIVVVGDMIDSSKTNIPVAMAFIKNAIEIADVYYVPGNHEAWSGQYDVLKKLLLDEGVTVLDDASVVLERSGELITLSGIMDPDFNPYLQEKYEIESVLGETLDGLEIDESSFNILLSHRPELFDLYVQKEFDLVFAGHAHGGQFRISFVGGVVAPNQGLFPAYTSGVYRSGMTSMVVSRGLANSIIPLRINNSPELVIVHLKRS